MTRIPNSTHLPTQQLIPVLAVLAAFGPLTTDLYMPALPSIAQDLKSPHVQQTMALYFIGLAVGQLIYGPLSDRVGRKVPLLFGCSLYTLASLGCALAPNMESLVGLRFLQALGASVGMVTTLSVVRDVFEVRQSARVLSYLMLVMGVAPILAPLLGGQILLYFNWRFIFAALALFGGLSVALVAWVLPESLPANKRNPSPMRTLFADYARLLADRRFLSYGLPQSLMGAGFFAYLAGASLVFIGAYGVSAQNFGFVFGLNAIGLIATSQLNAWLLGRYSGTQILPRALVGMVGVAWALVGVAWSGWGGMWGLWAVLFFCVAGNGLVRPNAQAAVMAPFPERAGLASSLLGSLGSGIGGLAGAALSLFEGPSALPLALIICTAYTLAWVLYLALRSSSAQANQ